MGFELLVEKLVIIALIDEGWEQLCCRAHEFAAVVCFPGVFVIA